MNLTLTLVRHAPTKSNQKGIFMGVIDESCDSNYFNEKIIRFIGAKSDLLYCSPLKRAYESARFMFPNTSINIDKRLIEKNLGDWAGQSKEKIKEQFQEAFLDSGNLNPFYIPNKGESFEELMIRTKDFLKDIVGQQRNSKKNKRIFVVTHNGVIRTMRCIIEKMQPMEFFSESEPFLTPIDFSFEISDWIKRLEI